MTTIIAVHDNEHTDVTVHGKLHEALYATAKIMREIVKKMQEETGMDRKEALDVFLNIYGMEILVDEYSEEDDE